MKANVGDVVLVESFRINLSGMSEDGNFINFAPTRITYESELKEMWCELLNRNITYTTDSTGYNRITNPLIGAYENSDIESGVIVKILGAE